MPRRHRPVPPRSVADQRQIVFMHFGEDLTQGETGARTGLSQTQVSRLLRRALQHMQMLAADIDRPVIPDVPRERAKNGRPFSGPSLKSLHQEFISCT